MYRLRRWWPALAALVVLAPLTAGLLALRRPAWYAPASIDYARLAQDKADAINTLDAIGAALNRQAPVDLVLTQDKCNRWLAARLEIWPGSETARLAPLERPVIELRADGVLRVGATARFAGWRTVISLTFRFETSGAELVIHWTGVRVGDLALPRSLVSGLIDRLVPADADPLRRFDAGVSRLPNRWIWPNGKAPFRVERVHVGRGRAELRLAPLSD